MAPTALLLALPLFALMSVASASLTGADVGNWTVGDCIMAQFAMELTLFPPSNKTNSSSATFPPMTIQVPTDAKVDTDMSNCKGETQSLSLDWSEKAPNGTDMLVRNITVEFANFNDSAAPASYGVQRFYAYFELAHFKQNYSAHNHTEMVNVTSFVDVDTGNLASDRLMFRTPLDRSYFCSRVKPKYISSHLHYTFPDAPSQGDKINDTRVDLVNMAFDAFRPKDAPHNNFQTPMDCDYMPNDIVPIVVGVCLAALVVFVIVAYIIGRRRHRQRGYQSV